MQSTDPLQLIESLDPDQIRDRLAELDRQSAALRTLLRAAVARDRRRLPPAEAPGQEVSRAS